MLRPTHKFHWTAWTMTLVALMTLILVACGGAAEQPAAPAQQQAATKVPDAIPKQGIANTPAPQEKMAEATAKTGHHCQGGRQGRAGKTGRGQEGAANSRRRSCARP